VPKPSKLTKLKEWLTVPDAARYLSALFDETVNDADVLRLALDGHLKLSVRFLGTVYGQLASVADSDIEPLEPNQVFDLPMSGAERLSVEAAYQREIGGPLPFFGDTEGTLVVDDWLMTYRLFSSGYKRLVGLPAHSVLALRRDVLDEFVRSAAGDGAPPGGATDNQTERPLGTRERETLYAMVAALCRPAGLDIRQPSKVAEAIDAEMRRLLPTPIALRTVQNILKRVRTQLGED
jgi:hypothetical protein